MKITNKKYRCPVCGNEEMHSTNHFGEIYTRCKKCHNTGMYCVDQNQFAGVPYVNAVVKFYRLDISNADEKALWDMTNEVMDYKGYKKFSCWMDWDQMQALRQWHNKTIKLYNIGQWDNQITSNMGRAFYWFEAVYPNKDIKEGYYLIVDMSSMHVDA